MALKKGAVTLPQFAPFVVNLRIRSPDGKQSVQGQSRRFPDD